MGRKALNHADIGKKLKHLAAARDSESPLVMILVSTAFIENALMSLFEQLLVKGETTKKLFDPGRPLGSYALCSEMAYCMGLISRRLYNTLEFIGKIRNKVAHTMEQPDFIKDPELNDWCRKIELPSEYEADPANKGVIRILKETIGINRFNIITGNVATYLLNKAAKIEKLKCTDTW